MRQFVLINSKGEKYSFNEKKSFMAEPSGLGYEFKVEYENYNDYFVEKDRELKQPKIKGKVYFSSYEEYYRFISFIQYRPLELEYTSHKTFYMICNVDKLEKKEYFKMRKSGMSRDDIEQKAIARDKEIAEKKAVEVAEMKKHSTEGLLEDIKKLLEQKV